MRTCSLLCLMETWPNDNMPDAAFKLDGPNYLLFWVDCDAHLGALYRYQQRLVHKQWIYCEGAIALRKSRIWVLEAGHSTCVTNSRLFTSLQFTLVPELMLMRTQASHDPTLTIPIIPCNPSTQWYYMWSQVIFTTQNWRDTLNSIVPYQHGLITSWSCVYTNSRGADRSLLFPHISWPKLPHHHTDGPSR